MTDELLTAIGTLSPRLLIVGPPGAGKGTQAARISTSFSIPAISTGDIFRANIAQGTPLGVKVKAIVDAGDYVPDSLTNDLVTDRLAQPDFAVRDAAEGHHRRPRPLRTETGKGLRVMPFLECGDRQHFRRRHHPLASPAVNTYFEHTLSDQLFLEVTHLQKLNELMEPNHDG